MSWMCPVRSQWDHERNSHRWEEEEEEQTVICEHEGRLQSVRVAGKRSKLYCSRSSCPCGDGLSN